MFDEEAKAVQEVAKLTGKAIDVVRHAGTYHDVMFGVALRQVGGIAAESARYFQYRNALCIAVKMKVIHDARRIEGKLIPIPHQ